jgi:hypothetical protein
MPVIATPARAATPRTNEFRGGPRGPVAGDGPGLDADERDRPASGHNVSMRTRALSLPALCVGLAALALAVLGLTFPGVLAGAAAAWLGGQAWARRNDDPVAVAALVCAAGALALGFIALVQTAYPG